MAIWHIGLASLARRRFYKNHNLLPLNRQHLGLGLSLTGSRWRSYIAPDVDTRQGNNVFQYVFIVYKDHFLKTLNIISVKVFIFVHVLSCILYKLVWYVLVYVLLFVFSLVYICAMWIELPRYYLSPLYLYLYWVWYMGQCVRESGGGRCPPIISEDASFYSRLWIWWGRKLKQNGRHWQFRKKWLCITIKKEFPPFWKCVFI